MAVTATFGAWRRVARVPALLRPLTEGDGPGRTMRLPLWQRDADSGDQVYFQAARTRAWRAGPWPVWVMEPYRRGVPDDRGVGPSPRYAIQAVGWAKRRKSPSSPNRGRAVTEVYSIWESPWGDQG